VGENNKNGEKQHKLMLPWEIRGWNLSFENHAHHFVIVPMFPIYCNLCYITWPCFTPKGHKVWGLHVRNNRPCM